MDILLLSEVAQMKENNALTKKRTNWLKWVLECLADPSILRHLEKMEFILIFEGKKYVQYDE